MRSSLTQRFAAVFFMNTSVAVAIFNSNQLSINCGQIFEVCYHDKKLILQKISSCTEIITNQAQNPLISGFQNNIFECKQEIPSSNIISNLNQFSVSQTDSISNTEQYFKLMMDESMLKFNALGLLLYYLTSFTQILNRKRLYLQRIQFWNDYIFQHVIVSSRQMKYLQIANLQINSSFVKTQVSNKDGLCILKIYDSYLKSKGAKRYLLRLLLNPTYNRKQLLKRFQLLNWMIKNMKDNKYYFKIFKNVYSVDLILQRCNVNKMKQEDWRKLIKTISSMIQLRKSLPMRSLPFTVKQFIDNESWNKVYKLFNLMKKMLNLSPFTIKDYYNHKLRQLRYLRYRIPRILDDISKDLNWGFPFKLLFITNNGFLVQISHSVQIPQQLLENWQFRYANNQGRYYSNQLTNNLDQQFGDIQSAIQDIQSDIFHQLENEVNEIAADLIDLYWCSCQVECFWGISQLGANMASPRLSEQQLIIVNGWNILLGEEGIENNYFSFCHQKGPKQRVHNSQLNIVNTNYSNRCSILTGPNGSGKTLLMKQIGAIFYLSHCGFYVPANMAQIPLIDRIFIIQTQKSFYHEDTGFKRQIISLSKVLNNQIITSKSLILIDQLGLSIDFTVALKVLYSCVSYFSNQQIGKDFKKNKLLSKQNDYFKIPITLIITHLTSLITNNFIDQNYMIRFFTMEVDNDFNYLFKIKPGVVQSGYGIKTAEMFVEPEDFIQDAYDYWNKLR